ncbi:MAG TPA: pirin family protein [Ramlibacter sp.]|nr:pirin family protein [Ramlibacter sp.]
MTPIARMQRANRGSQFRAYRLHGSDLAQLDPFIGIDHAWMSAPTFPPHPHAGFSAVTYLFLDSETGIANRDSQGNRTLIEPGGLHWTAAGRGVVHEENPAVLGSTAHLLQIFVNLAVDRQGAEPFALSIEPQDVPLVHLPGAKVRVPLGSFGNRRSPLRPPTDVSLVDISLEDGANLSVPILASHCSFIMPIFGALEIDGQSFDANELRLPVFSAQATAREVTLTAKHGPAKAVVFSGVPLRQPVHWQGSMAMASAEALNARIAAYQRGEFGSF